MQLQQHCNYKKSTESFNTQNNNCEERLDSQTSKKFAEKLQSEVVGWIMQLENMEDQISEMIQILESNQTAFESYYEQIQQVLIRKREIIRKEIRFYKREFENRQGCNVYDTSFQKTLLNDITHYSSMRQELETLQEYLNKGEIQQQLIELVNKVEQSENLHAQRIEILGSDCDEVQNDVEYKVLQEQEFNLTHQIVNKGGVKCFAVSSDWMYLIASQFENQMVMWNLQSDIKILEYQHQSIISAFTFSNFAEVIYFGDQKGQVSCLQFSNSFIWQKQIHKEEVYQVSESQSNQIITCSKDSKIILTDTSTQQTIWQINYICPCFSGFDISQNKQLIVAPNYKAFSIWNANIGNEITKFEYYNKEDQFIQTLFSYNMNQLLVGMGNQKRVLVFDIRYPEITLILRKEIYYTRCIKSISWCLNDKLILVNSQGYIQFRRSEDAKLVKYYFIYDPWYTLQKQDPQGEKIIFSQYFKIFICQRQQVEIDQKI